MTDEILKEIDNRKKDYLNVCGHMRMEPNSDYLTPLEALRVAYLALDVRSPSIKQIAEILGVANG